MFITFRGDFLLGSVQSTRPSFPLQVFGRLSTSLTHAAKNLQPPSLIALYQTPGSSAAVLQSPMMPTSDDPTEGGRRFMAAWKNEEVDAARHRQEKREATRL